MLDILQFIFSGFWTFIGTAILLGIVTRGLILLAAILLGRSVRWGG